VLGGTVKAAEPLPLPTVRLMITPLGPEVCWWQAYHSSILIDKVEYLFTFKGVEVNHNEQKSHDFMERHAETQIVDMGVAPLYWQSLVHKLSPYFQPGTYDLLRKNCNSFSDCVLFYLLGLRMNRHCHKLEEVGRAVEEATGLIHMLSLNGYRRNPAADGFRLEDVICAVGTSNMAGMHRAGLAGKTGL